MAQLYQLYSEVTNTATLVETDLLQGKRWDWAYPLNRWDKYYPYQLAILQTNSSDDEYSDPQGYTIYRELTFTLPYTPESMQVMMPFAISVQATQSGVVEQHGGAPFRQIVFQGTFGVYKARPAVPPKSGAISGILGGVFSATSGAAQGLIDAAKSLGGAATTPANLLGADADAMNTGYWQSLQLRRFLESYAEMKKTSQGKNLRLALIQWKERDAWLVTPLRFEVNRTAQSPFEYRYSLQFQAWKRVNPIEIGGSTNSLLANHSWGSGRLTPSLLQRVLNTIQNVRKVINAFIRTVVAVRADIQAVMNVLRTVALLVKLVVGAIKTLAELPAAILATVEEAVAQSWEILKHSFDGNVDPSVFSQVGDVNIEVNQMKAGTRDSSPALRKLLTDQSGSSYSFQSALSLGNMNLSTAQQQAIDNEDQRVLNLSTHDFQKMRDGLLEFMASYADQIGLGDPTYNQEFGRKAGPQMRAATLDDFRVLHALGSAAGAIGYLVSGTPPQQAPTVIEYVAGLANANGISMRVPNSKFVVPFPYGGSLEKLAQQYLGDAGRWMEIAELNELRAPYVDEVGTVQALLTNGKGNVILVADASRLLIGQLVWVYSLTSLSEKRHIVNIQRTGYGSTWALTLNGAGDLAKLKTSDHASIQYYQPGTVNCQQVIFIPSDRVAEEDVLKYVPSGDDISRVLDRGEVDGMLT